MMPATNSLLLRCVPRAEAARLCSISPTQFTKWVKLGIAPRPLPGTKRWLVADLDSFLGGAKSEVHQLKETDLYQQWKLRRGQKNAGSKHRP